MQACRLEPWLLHERTQLSAAQSTASWLPLACMQHRETIGGAAANKTEVQAPSAPAARARARRSRSPRTRYSPRVVFFVAAISAFVVLGLLSLSVLFEPGLAYKVPANVPAPDSDALIRVVTALSDAQMRRGCAVEVFPEATTFYPAEHEAIAASVSSVHLEAYIFRNGVNAQKLLALLTERAKAGVSVKLVLDSFGNLFVRKKIFADLVAAGGRVVWYQPVAWSSIKRYNNRTHRELLIVDGKVGFCGGAGIADWWTGDRGKAPWRGQHVQGGPAIWRSRCRRRSRRTGWRASGEILLVEADFPRLPPREGDGEDGPTEGTKGFVVASTPHGRSLDPGRASSSSRSSPRRARASPSTRPTSSPTRAPGASWFAPCSAAFRVRIVPRRGS